MEALLPIPLIQNLKTNVACVLAMNPGPFTMQGTNTFILGSGAFRILVDTGENKSKYLENLSEVFETQGIIGLTFILVTHHHTDHIGGVEGIIDWLRAKNCPTLPKVFIAKPENKVYNDIFDGQEWQVEGCTVTAIRTPGHTNDHTSFYLKNEKILITGDCVLGQGYSPVFEDLYDHIKSLQKLSSIDCSILCPGHGPIEFNGDSISQLIKHRQERENQIYSLLREQEMSIEQIVGVIYHNYPSGVLEAAKKTVMHHLLKLQKEAKIENDEQVWKIK